MLVFERYAARDLRARMARSASAPILIDPILAAAEGARAPGRRGTRRFLTNLNVPDSLDEVS
jgi:hypothetical protein